MKSYARKDFKASIVGANALLLHGKHNDAHIFCLFNFAEEECIYNTGGYAAQWRKVLDSKDSRWSSAGSATASNHPSDIRAGEGITIQPLSVVVYSSSHQ